MQPVFVDTFNWIALLNPDDPDHDRVTAFDLAPDRPLLVTTEEVLTEFLTYSSDKGTLFRRKAVDKQMQGIARHTGCRGSWD